MLHLIKVTNVPQKVLAALTKNQRAAAALAAERVAVQEPGRGVLLALAAPLTNALASVALSERRQLRMGVHMYTVVVCVIAPLAQAN